jgi:CRP-like cAMP-binding protein
MITTDSDGKAEGNSFHALDLSTYVAGDEIIREGEASPCFFVILDGQVRISKQRKLLRIIEDHQVFGLETILLKQPVPYTAKASTKARVARYAPEALDHFLRSNPQMSLSILKSMVEQLTETGGQLTDEAESYAIEDMRVDFFGDGEAIIVEGASGTDFYRLVSTQGGLRVTRGGQEIGRIDKLGEFFGEMAGLLQLPRQATVTSIGESVVERYGNDELEIIIRDYPDVALTIMRTLVARLSELSKKHVEVLTQSC